MSISQRQTVSWGSGPTLLTTVVNKTGAVEQNYDITVANNTSDQAVDLQWAAAKLLSLFITTDVAVTLEMNSSSAATDTIALNPDVPFNWLKDSGVPYPFTGTAGAITAGYLTNADHDPDAAANVKIRVLLAQ